MWSDDERAWFMVPARVFHCASLRMLALISCLLAAAFVAFSASPPAAHAARKQACAHRKHEPRRCRRSRRRPFWNGNLARDNWSQWNGSPAYHPDGNPADFAIVSSPSPPGVKHAFRATLQSGGGSVVGGEDGERTLLTLWPGTDDGVRGSSHAYQGASTWYRDMIYFPASFRPTAHSTWNWLWMLHDYPDTPCCANVALDVVTGNAHRRSGSKRLSLRIMGGGTPSHPIDSGRETANHNPHAVVKWIRGPQLKRRMWYDMVVHVHWDWRSKANGGRGFVVYYLNGRKIGSYTGPTLFYYHDRGPDGTGSGPGQAYLQEGYYRPDNSEAGYAQPTVSVYHADAMDGPTAASIGERSL